MSDVNGMGEEPALQGDVTVHHFPGVLGYLGWGWLHPRFLVLEHSVVLMYGDEDDWIEHREPEDDIALSAEATVELSEDGDEAIVKLRRPGHAPVTFSGATTDGDGLSSEEWYQALNGQIQRLVRERAPPPKQSGSSGASLSSWRFWNYVSSAVENAGAAGVRNSVVIEPEERQVSFNFGEGSSSDDDDGNDDDEEKRGDVRRDSRRQGDAVGQGQGVGASRETAEGERPTSVRSRRNGQGDRSSQSTRFVRWPLQRGGSVLRISDPTDSTRTDDVPMSRTRGRELWATLRSAFRTRDCHNCVCKWCKEGGHGSHAEHAKTAPRVANYRQKCHWSRSTHKGAERMTSPAVDRWEYLVGRWIPLQLARSGDTDGIRNFLKKFPHFPDKANLLRAAVRYKQYSLVQYFLDEEHMDVNVENIIGMPLVWFSVVYMQKGDSGVMLRYLLQKGANIKSRSIYGQNVLFIVVSSRGKEAIPMLKYLVEECGLSLTERDNFGSLPLHWAVLYGHMDTVQWICRYTSYWSTRADWAGSFHKMEKIRLVRPEHMGAVRSWRMRGLQKSARSLTPLGVAVLHNHEDVAKWLMGYGSEDAACIAFKRNNLFSDENRDLALVAKIWPELLPEVLRGFEVQDKRQKYSWDTDDKETVTPTGWSERTYDLKLLYGSPEVPANRSPMNILLSTGYAELFEVKVVQMVVALKWSVFGQRFYLWELARYVVLTLSFILGFIMWSDSSNWVGTIDLDDDHVEVIGGTISRMACWVLTLYNLFIEEGRELKASKSFRKYILGGWNLQSVIAYVLVLSLVAVFRPWTPAVPWELDEGSLTTDGLIRRVMTAPAALLLFTRFMEHLAVWKSTGVFIAVIRMVIVDTASWAVLFILFEVGFALSFFALLRGNEGYETAFDSMVSVFVMSIGEVSPPFSDDRTLHVVAVFMFLTFMLMVTIVYLNLLVAMMTSEYTKVVNEATAEAMMNRAAALVKWEGIMCVQRRQKAFETVAPGKGGRSHVRLKGYFGGGATPELFCSEEGATAVEPEQSNMSKSFDPQKSLMKELTEIKAMLKRVTKGQLPRTHPGDAEYSFKSSSDEDASFRQRQAGMLDAHGNGLSALRLTRKDRKVSMGSVTNGDLQEWRRKARAIEEEASSRRGVVRAQAIVRGYLSRARSRALFLPDNKDSNEDEEDDA